jgi:hypothetical protein
MRNTETKHGGGGNRRRVQRSKTALLPPTNASGQPSCDATCATEAQALLRERSNVAVEARDEARQ